MKEKYYEKLSQLSIFNGIEIDKLPSYLLSLRAYAKEFKKGDYIYIEGDRDIKLCVILSGGVELIRNDYWGKEFLIAKLSEYDVFGETFALMRNAPIDLDVMASDDSLILQIDMKMLDFNYTKWLDENTILRDNLLNIFAMKNYYLSKRLKVISQRRTREKLIEFLMQQRLEKKASKFNIGMSRTQLADYLCVDRSALSIEMRRMKEEGIIDFNKRMIEIKDKENKI